MLRHVYADMFGWNRSWMPLLAVGLLLGAMSTPADAYLDGGSGSYLVQIALASALASLVMVRSGWASLKDGLVRLVSRKDGSTTGDC